MTDGRDQQPGMSETLEMIVAKIETFPLWIPFRPEIGSAT
jgi:hypothetical protein